MIEKEDPEYIDIQMFKRSAEESVMNDFIKTPDKDAPSKNNEANIL